MKKIILVALFSSLVSFAAQAAEGKDDANGKLPTCETVTRELSSKLGQNPNVTPADQNAAPAGDAQDGKQAN